jgi:hypothetical protein
LAENCIQSQPRIAKAEKGDASVSIELLIRAMLRQVQLPQEIGQVIAQAGWILELGTLVGKTDLPSQTVNLAVQRVKV